MGHGVVLALAVSQDSKTLHRPLVFVPVEPHAMAYMGMGYDQTKHLSLADLLAAFFFLCFISRYFDGTLRENLPSSKRA